ncbi:MAG: hypothetical protein ATN34_00970 [Epulopiscium sp. Nele67-Bin002]|nr:MAG: hypothetical protein ATN33_08515 [Epulopiscium sp. Nele67-Bin001]OON92757.1 MAG: hypothetical protein ATN34_00970 [Epulopiscium sp. Nele67-Bin002]
MKYLLQSITFYESYVVIGVLFINLALFVLVIRLMNKLNKVQKKYQIFMKTENVDLEGVLSSNALKIEYLNEQVEENKNLMANLEHRMNTSLRKISVTRYKAIQNVGSDLSFIVALLDENNTGVVVNGIYSRDGSYTYAKPIVKGQSNYVLSDEEAKTLADAMQKS